MSNNIVNCPNCQQAISFPPGVSEGCCPYCSTLVLVPKKGLSKRSVAIVASIEVGGILFLLCLALLLYPLLNGGRKKRRRNDGGEEQMGAVFSPRENARRLSCVSNLKQIGMALEFYTQTSIGQLRPHGITKSGAITPDAVGAANALELLRSEGHLTDYGVYVCPSSTASKGKGTDSLTYAAGGKGQNLSYGYVYITAWYSSASAVSSDLNVGWGTSYSRKGKANHEDYGNILYADGHVRGFVGDSDPDSSKTWYSKENTGKVQIHPNIAPRQ